VGVAIGEAGGSPPSHSLISDYFPKSARGTAFSIFALAVPLGTMIGAPFAGWSNVNYGWRATFVIVGLPGVVLALLAWLTIKEPPRGFSDNVDPSVARAKAPLVSPFELGCGTPLGGLVWGGAMESLVLHSFARVDATGSGRLDCDLCPRWRIRDFPGRVRGRQDQRGHER
jgi:MFS family permease